MNNYDRDDDENQYTLYDRSGLPAKFYVRELLYWSIFAIILVLIVW